MSLIAVPGADLQWADLGAADQWTNVKHNSFKEDILAVINGGIDTSNIGSTALATSVIDGVAMTLGTPSGGSDPQSVTRGTSFSGRLISGGEYRTPITTLTIATAITVTGARTGIINNTGGPTTIEGLSKTSPIAGDGFTLIVTGSGNVTLEHGTDVNDFFLQGAADLVYTGATGRCLVVDFIYSDLAGTLGSTVWIEKSRRTQ